MEYPKNGSVLVIDDRYDDIASLLRVLNKHKVPTLYFNGDIDDFPEDGLENIRFVFLDLELENDSGNAGQEKFVISKLMAILRKAINKNNGQYVIAAWSSMISNYFIPLQEAIEKDKNKEHKSQLNVYPQDIISLSKADMKTDGEFDIEKIKNSIEASITKNTFLPYYISWENMVLESSKKVLNQFDKISDTQTDIAKIIALFAKGSNMVKDDSSTNDILQYGFTPLSSMLIDELQSNIANEVRLELIDEATKNKIVEKVKKLSTSEQITDEQRAKINTLFHIDDSGTCSNSNGQVYLYDDYLHISCSTSKCNIKWAEDLKTKIFDQVAQKTGYLKINQKRFQDQYDELDSTAKGQLKKSKEQYIQDEIKEKIKIAVIPIFLEISPACDITKNKRKKLRLIFGVMIPIDLRYESKGDNFTKPSLTIQYQGNSYEVVFDLHTITGINLEAFQSLKPCFRFKKEFVTEIQHQAAVHMSRPGFFNMNDYP